MVRLILIILCLFLSLAAEEENLIVRVQTEAVLIPISLNTTDLPAELSLVTKFDFEKGARLLLTSDSEASYQVSFLQSGQMVHARVFDRQTGKTTKTSAYPLSSDAAKDRRKIHHIADEVHKIITGEKGIASTRFLFTLKGKRGTKAIAEVFEADYDGANPRQLTHENSFVVTPCYLPPKEGGIPTHFFYASYVDGLPKIYLSSLDTGKAAPCLQLSGNQIMPTCDLKRTKLAFISDAAGNPDLFIQPLPLGSGKPQQIFASRHATQASPSFSPDGRRIAFVSNKDGQPKVYVMDIPKPGTKQADLQPKLLSRFTVESSAPSWSPDGKKIAFCALTKGIRQIFVFDFEEGKERQITEGSLHKENPTFAPNSLHLLYNTTSGETNELFLTDLILQKPTQITSGGGDKQFPSWQPTHN